MARIYFGVMDVPYRYVQQQQTKKGKRKGRPIVLSQTTGEVADHLEKKYKIFETFYETHREQIQGIYAQSVEDACEALLSGAPVGSVDPYASANSKVVDMFKKWLSSRGMDNLVAGVPTAASGALPEIRKGGINHRLAHPYASTNPVRPSFIDTGNFESTAIVYVE